MLQQPDDVWTQKTMQRLETLGFGGFTYDSGLNWWPIDKKGRRVDGPFSSITAFDAWIDDKESLRR